MCKLRYRKAIVSIALFAAHLVALADVRYTVTPIGTNGAVPVGINNSGQVVGFLPSENVTHAFLYTGASFVDLGTLGGESSRASGINDLGVVVGDADDAAGNPRAFVFSKGLMSDLGTLGGPMSRAAAINDRGQIAGVADSLDGSFAFLYSPGIGMQNLGTLPGGVGSRAEGINNEGIVVGGSIVGDSPLPPFHAFLYTAGSMNDLGSLNGSFSVGQAINDSGEVVGWSNGGFDIDHAFLYSAGVITDLGTLTGSGSSVAYDINNAGQAVGWSEVANRETRGVLYQGGAIIELNTLIDSASGWTVEAAYAINDRQQIAAFGCSGNTCQALLLEPVSLIEEPATGMLLLAGIGVIGWARRPRPLVNR
jgi:probable HAF family extracellular repeat protein